MTSRELNYWTLVLIVFITMVLAWIGRDGARDARTWEPPSLYNHQRTPNALDAIQK